MLPVIDIDQHYYEPDDCCTRHAEAKYQELVPRPVATETGEREWRFGDRHISFERWVRDITLAPGAMFDARTGRLASGDLELVQTAVPEFRDRATRLKLLDEWDIDAAVMLQT